MTRSRAGPPLPLQAGDGAVELMIELMSVGMFLPSHAPLVAFGTAGGSWSAWTQTRVTAFFRGVVALAGLPAAEYALHSLRIGGATFFTAKGASADVVEREGRWKSDAFKGYVRSHGVDAQVVSDILADENAQRVLQPGQKTVWGING